MSAGFGLWQQCYASNRALDETYFESAMNAMQTYTTDEGHPLAIRPTHVIVPTSLAYSAKRLFQPILASGESNIHANELQVIVSHFLPNS